MEQQEMLSEADMVAAVVSGRGKRFAKTQTVQVVAKLPIYHVGKLDALAAQAGQTRTETLSMLLGVGLEEVMRRVDQPIAEHLVELEAEALARLMGEGGA
jgi:hypothetical protein